MSRRTIIALLLTVGIYYVYRMYTDAEQQSVDLLTRKQQSLALDKTTNHTSQGVDFYVAGSNSYRQILDSDCKTFDTFTRTLRNAPDFSVLYAGWTTTVLSFPDVIFGISQHQRFVAPTAEGAQPFVPNGPGFGTKDGFTGFVEQSGQVVLLLPQLRNASFSASVFEPGGTIEIDWSLFPVDMQVTPALGFVAIAGNDRVVATRLQAPDQHHCHVMEFETLTKFAGWLKIPNSEIAYPDVHYTLLGRPKQLLANEATFLLPMDDGEVYSWGDPSYNSLGRNFTGEQATPAREPGLVEALQGLQITKIASEGLLSAALSRENVLYLWGVGRPGVHQQIRSLRKAPEGEVVLVEIKDDSSDKRLDVLDVAVGDGHVLGVAGNRLFGAGENGRGQLGIKQMPMTLESGAHFVEDWTQVETFGDVQAVTCGPETSFIFVTSGHEEERR